jgi:hypothetical protein
MKLKRFDEINEEIGPIHMDDEERLEYERGRNENKITLNLTKEEANALLYCLARTMAKGDQLTIGMEIEDKLSELLKK